MKFESVFNSCDDGTFDVLVSMEDGCTGRITISPDLRVSAISPKSMSKVSWLNHLRKVIKVYCNIICLAYRED